MGAPYFYFTPPSLQQLFSRAPILFLKKKDQTHYFKSWFYISRTTKKENESKTYYISVIFVKVKVGPSNLDVQRYVCLQRIVSVVT